MNQSVWMTELHLRPFQQYFSDIGTFEGDNESLCAIDSLYD